MTRLRVATTLAALLVLVQPAAGQTYPARPVTMVISFAAGSSIDVVGSAAPDGYQFVLGATGGFAQNQSLYKNLPYNAATDFAPVALLAETPPVLVARK